MVLFAEQQAGPFNLTSVFFMLALVCVTWFLLMRSRRRWSRRDEAPVVRIERPAAEKRRGLGDSPEAIAAWEVHVYETARELSAQLDSKMGALQHLVREADRAAARLEKALAGAEAAAPGADPCPVPGPPDRPAGRRDDEICLLADYGFDPQEIARRTDLAVGEVQRVLRLRGKRQEGGGAQE